MAGIIIASEPAQLEGRYAARVVTISGVPIYRARRSGLVLSAHVVAELRLRIPRQSLPMQPLGRPLERSGADSALTDDLMVRRNLESGTPELQMLTVQVGLLQFPDDER